MGDGERRQVMRQQATLDQPTIVPNLTRMRTVDQATSLISWSGGAVQAANRSKIGTLNDAALIWRFNI